MAKQRVYRHDIRCPRCGSNWMPKDGVSRGRQVYACGDCKHRHVPGGRFRRFSDAEKDTAIAMYTDGSSLSAAARTVGASLTAVRAWVKKRGPARSGGGGSVSGGGQAGAWACGRRER